jgi:hypothetical protein
MKERDQQDTNGAAAGAAAQTGAATAADTQAGATSPATTAAATAAAAAQAGAQETDQQGAVAVPYAAAGAAFTNWFNDKVSKLSNPTVMLGTKRARVVALYEDGRLAVEVETEALEPERQFVLFESQHLDQLVRKIAALGL